MSRLEKYMVNEISMPSWVTGTFNKIKDELEKLSFSQFKKKCEDAHKTVMASVPETSEKEMFELEQELDIPTHLRYYKTKNEPDEINEDAAHLWGLIKAEAFPTLAFYPALQVWLELDKILKGTPYSGKVIGFYAAFWLILMSGKHITQWKKWKKEYPDEYEKEKSVGKGGLL
jgi:hypothetical protein